MIAKKQIYNLLIENGWAQDEISIKSKSVRFRLKHEYYIYILEKNEGFFLFSSLLFKQEEKDYEEKYATFDRIGGEKYLARFGKPFYRAYCSEIDVIETWLIRIAEAIREFHIETVDKEEKKE